MLSECKNAHSWILEAHSQPTPSFRSLFSVNMRVGKGAFSTILANITISTIISSSYQ